MLFLQYNGVMEWLILYREDHEKDASEIKQMLKVHEIESSTLLVEKLIELDDESINFQVKNANYCVLLDNELLVEDKFSFFYGYLIGHVKHFYSLKNEWAKSMSYFKNVTILTGVRALFSKLEKQLEQIKIEEISREAFTMLFNDGIPFTADCFAENIALDNREICERFIKAGIDINCRTKNGVPMLNIAIRAEQLDCIDWILSQNVDIDAISDDRGYSAVMDAVWKSNYELTKKLVDSGANLNFISRDGQSVLVLAVGGGKPEICKLLVESGADPDVKDKMGMSAYEYAKLFGKDSIVKLLDQYHKI